MRNAVSAAAFTWLALVVPGAHAQELTIPKAMCDAGVFAAGGTHYSFEDIIVESNRASALNDKGPISAYGYLVSIEFGAELNDRVNATISTVDKCYNNIGVVQTDTNLRVDVVFMRSDFSDEAWKDLRRTMLRVSENTLNAIALVKLTGQFGIYSNTYGLYYRATDVAVLAAFP